MKMSDWPLHEFFRIKKKRNIQLPTSVEIFCSGKSMLDGAEVEIEMIQKVDEMSKPYIAIYTYKDASLDADVSTVLEVQAKDFNDAAIVARNEINRRGYFPKYFTLAQTGLASITKDTPQPQVFHFWVEDDVPVGISFVDLASKMNWISDIAAEVKRFQSNEH